MAHEKNDGLNNDVAVSPSQQNETVFPSRLKRKLKMVPPSLGKLRPTVGQCCMKCTPGSLHGKLGQKSIPSFHNLLSIDNTHARYQGWLVRRISCLLFVSGCKVSSRPSGNRLERIGQSNRVKEVVAVERQAPEGRGVRELTNRLSPYLPLINTSIVPSLVRFVGWLMLKVFASVFDNIQVDLNQLAPLQRASQEGSLLLYVHVRQSLVDCALVPLVLFCHKLAVPYAVCPLQCSSYSLRAILQRVGVLLLPPSLQTEEDAERDSLFSPVMTSLVDELLHEGQPISVGLSAETGRGGQWLAHIAQLLKRGSVTDVTLVPVGISYDRVLDTRTQVGLGVIFQCLWSLIWRKRVGSEMCEGGRWSADEWLPLQDLLLPIILGDRTKSASGQRRMSWLLPSSHRTPDLRELTHLERDLSVAVIRHLAFSLSSCAALMSTSLMSTLLLHRHRKGVKASLLCQDLAWLTTEVLFRNKDVGFQGSLAEIAHHSLSLLAPHLIIAAAPSRKDPFIMARVSPAASVHLSRYAQIVTHTFILEAVGACAVSAMLCEVVSSGVSARVRGGVPDEEEVKGDLEFDVVLCQSELTDRALQLCLLLPPGFQPPCQSSQSFAMDAVDRLVHCGILVIEETPRDVPTCDFWKREGLLTWTTGEDSGHSDSDCEEQEACSYKISQPSQCPEMLFFLCSMLAGHLRALCWTTAALDLLHVPLPEAEFVARIHSHLCDTANKKKQHYESCTKESARTAVRTLIDLGVISEHPQEGGAVSLHVAPRFQLPENRQKLTHFISQYVYN
ncbi:glycerol-3-phosphate acyltransferase 2, mitochondrial isoform X2 [Nelusetta ayraudi]|uniref:glycerol-3-phosphate acyltransferase 2, mitochondrial isoform X2 n=1 Tax=Nelusetta ayraudi TaxID=303726 RepID=UPI003F7146B8